jgi:hypothetical protein
MSSGGQKLGLLIGAVAGFFTAGAGWAAMASSVLQGASFGMTIGGMIDPPPGPDVTGPRLEDTSVQLATYGAHVPRIYGSMGTYGTMFWIENNRLKEVKTTKKVGEGKTKSKVTTYTYYLTCAIALAHGEISGVRRIWLSDILWYDAGSDDIAAIMASNGNSKKFKFYSGNVNQPPDSRMQATLGVANTPAYRGICYLMLYDIDMTDFGNSAANLQVRVEVADIVDQYNGVREIATFPLKAMPGADDGSGLNMTADGVLNVWQVSLNPASNAEAAQLTRAFIPSQSANAENLVFATAADYLATGWSDKNEFVSYNSVTRQLVIDSGDGPRDIVALPMMVLKDPVSFIYHKLGGTKYVVMETSLGNTYLLDVSGRTASVLMDTTPASAPHGMLNDICITSSYVFAIYDSKTLVCYSRALVQLWSQNIAALGPINASGGEVVIREKGFDSVVVRQGHSFWLVDAATVEFLGQSDQPLLGNTGGGDHLIWPLWVRHQSINCESVSAPCIGHDWRPTGGKFTGMAEPLANPAIAAPCGSGSTAGMAVTQTRWVMEVAPIQADTWLEEDITTLDSCRADMNAFIKSQLQYQSSYDRSLDFTAVLANLAAAFAPAIGTTYKTPGNWYLCCPGHPDGVTTVAAFTSGASDASTVHMMIRSAGGSCLQIEWDFARFKRTAPVAGVWREEIRISVGNLNGMETGLSHTSMTPPVAPPPVIVGGNRCCGSDFMQSLTEERYWIEVRPPDTAGGWVLDPAMATDPCWNPQDLAFYAACGNIYASSADLPAAVAAAGAGLVGVSGRPPDECWAPGANIHDFTVASVTGAQQANLVYSDGSMGHQVNFVWIGSRPGIWLEGVRLISTPGSQTQPCQSVHIIKLADVLTHCTTLESIVRAECLQLKELYPMDIDTSQLTSVVCGYKITKVAAIRGGLEPLRAAYPFDAVQSGYRLRFIPRGRPVTTIVPQSALGTMSDSGDPSPLLTTEIEMTTQLPSKVIIQYYDRNREYDTNAQYAERINGETEHIREMELAINLDANEAAGIAEVLLYLAWAERYHYSFSLGAEWSKLEPADVIALNADGQRHELRLTNVEYQSDGTIVCMAKPNRSAIYLPVSIGQEGEIAGSHTIVAVGPTTSLLIDGPAVLGALDAPGFVVAQRGFTQYWRGGALQMSGDAGGTYQLVASTEAPSAVIGTTEDALESAGTFTIFDTSKSVTVKMSSGVLSSASEISVLNGQNHFLIGNDGRWEVIAAKNCVLLADKTYLLSDLLRGRYGTEWAHDTHRVGDYVVPIDFESAKVFVPMESSLIDRQMRWLTQSLGADEDLGVTQDWIYHGVNLECYSPVHPSGYRDANGWKITFHRRTRIGGELRDSTDALLGERVEAYEMDILDSAGQVLRTLKSNVQEFFYTAADESADFAISQGKLSISIYQLSEFCGRGYPLHATINS